MVTKSSQEMLHYVATDHWKQKIVNWNEKTCWSQLPWFVSYRTGIFKSIF